MSEWLVRLKGHEFDLQQLSEHFCSPERSVSRDEDGNYYLRSSDFDSLADDSAVCGYASKLIEYINGAAKLHSGGSYGSVEFDGISRIDEEGNRHNFVYLSGAIEVRSRISARVVVGAGDVEEPPQLPSWVEFLVSLAERDQRVADALHFFQGGNWLDLYKAWEVVGDAAGGAHNVIKNRWATRRAQSRFTGTAQSRAELGDEARHASRRFEAPQEPMSLDEARAFVKSVMEAWIRTL